jgi:predicted  nucleic acid-binding Zn-ribbon protein
MGATIEALHRLQEIELQLAEVRRRIDRKVRACTRQEQVLTELDDKIAEHQAQLRASQIEADRQELDARAREAEIAKLRVALNVSKNNKEYSAVLTQLNTFKADNSKVEDRVLALLSEVDQKRKDIAAVQEQRAKEAAKLEGYQAKARETEDKAKDRLVRLGAERDEAAEAVPPLALELFSRVAGKHNGEAMASVIRTHPKRQEYACDACNMSITIEQVNTILSRDEAVICNVCGHILYFEPHAAPSAG